MRSDRRPEAGSIVIVTERRLYPPHQGNRARIIELIRALRASGYRVILISRAIRRWSVWLRTRLLVDSLVTVEASGFSGGDPGRYDCSPFVPALADTVRKFQPDAVLAEYLWMAPCLGAVPRGIPTLIDTHDVMHVRGRMYGGLEGGAWVDCSREDEARLLGKADIIIAIQRNEQELFRAMVPGRTVVCVPHVCHSQRSWLERRPASDVVTFIGSGNAANAHGMEAFIERGWPRVRKRCPHAELRVYGAVATRLWPGFDGVTLVGAVQNLENAYGQAKVVINPATLGTGLKIKNVEALARGKALVTTSSGASGLEEGSGEAFLVEDDMVRFGDRVVDLLSDDCARQALETSARVFAQHRFSREAVLQELIGALRDHTAGWSQTSGSAYGFATELP